MIGDRPESAEIPTKRYETADTEVKKKLNIKRKRTSLNIFYHIYSFDKAVATL